MERTPQAHSKVILELHPYEDDMKALLFPQEHIGKMLCGSSYDNNPKMQNSDAYFLVLLHITIKENTNFALFTLEVMGQKGQKMVFLPKSYPSPPLNPSNRTSYFTSFPECPPPHPEILESEGGMWFPPHSLSCWVLSTSSNSLV